MTAAGQRAPVRIDRIGKLADPELKLLLARRRLSSESVRRYASMLRRAERFCRSEGLALDELDPAGLDRFMASLPQTRGMLWHAKTALRHYWEGTGRRDAPDINVVGVMGRAGRDPSEGLAARERTARGEPGPLSSSSDRPLYDGLRARQLGPRTAAGYLAAIRRFAKWCEANGTSIDTATTWDLDAFAACLPRTRSTIMQVRLALLHYYAITGRPDPPTHVLRVPRRKRMISKALSDEEARKLEGAAVERRDLKGLAVVLGLYLGLRRFEIAQLRWSDFGNDGWLTFVGKGDLEATLPVHRVVQEYLRATPRRGEFVFPGRFGGPANPTTVWGWVREVSAAAGIREVPTHVLRHTALALGNDVTGDLRAVQDFARHAEPNTTAGYTRATRERLERVAKAIGDAYRPPATEEIASPGPTLSFAELVATVEGAHAVRAWSDLAEVLGDRPGWRFAGSMEGEGLIRFEHSPLLHATAMAWTNDRPATFVIWRYVDPGAEDFDTWDFPDARTLGVVIASFEAGGSPFPPTAEFRVSEGAF